jgi:hypothetical protein
LQNKATKLLKTLRGVPKTDKTKPILGGTDRQTKARASVHLGGKELAHEADFEEQWGPKKVPKQSYRFVDNKGHSGFGFGNKPTECCR